MIRHVHRTSEQPLIVPWHPDSLLCIPPYDISDRAVTLSPFLARCNFQFSSSLRNKLTSLVVVSIPKWKTRFGSCTRMQTFGLESVYSWYDQVFVFVFLGRENQLYFRALNSRLYSWRDFAAVSWLSHVCCHAGTPVVPEHIVRSALYSSRALLSIELIEYVAQQQYSSFQVVLVLEVSTRGKSFFRHRVLFHVELVQ